jgi:hypothetical protein
MAKSVESYKVSIDNTIEAVGELLVRLSRVRKKPSPKVLDQIVALTSAYARLVGRSQPSDPSGLDLDSDEYKQLHGDPDYYDSLLIDAPSMEPIENPPDDLTIARTAKKRRRKIPTWPPLN